MEEKYIHEIKKILILGTGNAQVDIIKSAKKMGLEVHTCSYKPIGKGIDLSDFFSIINITDIKSVGAYVTSNNIDLVYSVGSDLATPTIAKVSENLHLPNFVSYETSMICNKKNRMRKAIESHKKYTIKYKELLSYDDLNTWTQFPAILKPTDSQGQRGITEVSSGKELKNAYTFALSYSENKKVIIEEYIEGYEISVNTYIVDTEIKFILITDRNSFSEYHGGIIKSHKFPSNNKIKKEDIYTLVKEVLTTLNISNGPVYFQIKINSKGTPKVIEVTPRLDGCHLWRLIEKLYGINLIEISLNHLINGSISNDLFNSLTPKFNSIELSFFTASSKDLYTNDLHKVHKNAVCDEKYYNEGDTISTINKFAEKVGYQIIAE